ncbi:MAG: hypothetical protein BWY19_01053 [bacterium ADurb.Bin212]|jgi:hypothetical protein|nr:MAG: hypothetical protein BWY19_01053 [bacterium ADurb.Bin212]
MTSKNKIYNVNGTDYMTISGASEYLGVSRAAVYLYWTRGYFSSIRIDKLILIDFNELVARRQRLNNKT